MTSHAMKATDLVGWLDYPNHFSFCQALDLSSPPPGRKS